MAKIINASSRQAGRQSGRTTASLDEETLRIVQNRQRETVIISGVVLSISKIACELIREGSNVLKIEDSIFIKDLMEDNDDEKGGNNEDN